MDHDLVALAKAVAHVGKCKVDGGLLVRDERFGICERVPEFPAEGLGSHLKSIEIGKGAEFNNSCGQKGRNSAGMILDRTYELLVARHFNALCYVGGGRGVVARVHVNAATRRRTQNEGLR